MIIEGLLKQKKGLDVRQARRMVYDRSKWLDFDEMPQLCVAKAIKAFEGWKSVCGQAYNLKGIKGNISFFSSLS